MTPDSPEQKLIEALQELLLEAINHDLPATGDYISTCIQQLRFLLAELAELREYKEALDYLIGAMIFVNDAYGARSHIAIGEGLHGDWFKNAPPVLRKMIEQKEIKI